MNCHQINENLSAFIDNELSSDDTNIVKAHLIRCSGCRQQRDKMEEIGRNIRYMAPLTTPADFEFRVFAGIRKHEARRTNRFFWRWQTILLPAACLIVGILLGVTSNSVFNFPESSLLTSSESTVESDSLVAVSDQEILYDYHLGRFARRAIIPVAVDVIPESPDVFDSLSFDEQSGFDSGISPPPQYVLDNIPMRVSYERTIY